MDKQQAYRWAMQAVRVADGILDGATMQKLGDSTAWAIWEAYLMGKQQADGRATFETMPDVLEVKDVVKLIPASKGYIRKLVKIGELPARRVGWKLLILKSDVLELFNGGTYEQDR